MQFDFLPIKPSPLYFCRFCDIIANPKTFVLVTVLLTFANYFHNYQNLRHELRYLAVYLLLKYCHLQIQSECRFFVYFDLKNHLEERFRPYRLAVKQHLLLLYCRLFLYLCYAELFLLLPCYIFLFVIKIL